MIDGEGCVHINNNNGSSCVQITNTEPSLLTAIEQAMDVLGIPRRKRNALKDMRGRTPCFTIRVGGGFESYKLLRALVPIQSAKKRAKLDALIAKYPPRRERPTAEWLIDHYVNKKWTALRIGNHWGMDAHTVTGWLHKLGVPRRNKREAGCERWALQRSHECLQ